MRIKKTFASASIVLSAIVMSAVSVTGTAAARATSNATGKTVVIATNQYIDNFDPIDNLGGDVNAPVETTVYETLLTTTLRGTISPLLASKWTVSPNGLVYTFYLRHGVKFQNGQPMTSADVVYSFDRAKSQAVPQVLERFDGVKSIQALNTYTVQITLSQRNSDFIYEIADPTDIGFAVLPNGITSKEIATHPIGTGPFDFVSYQPDSELVLRVNRSYWNPAVLPKYNTLIVRFITQDASQVAALQTGQVSFITPQAYSTIEGLKGQSSYVVKSFPDYGFWLNLSRNGITRNDNIAQAISLAINRSALSEVAYQGQAIPGSTAFPGTADALPWNKLPNYSQNLKKARALLKAAGYPNGIKLTFIYPNEAPYSQSMFEVMQSQLAQAGINITLQPLDPNVWLPRFLNANYQLSVTDQSWYSDPERYVLPRTGWQAPPQQVLPNLTTMLNRYEAAAPSQQPALFQQVQQLEAKNAYPFIGLLWTNSYAVYNSKLLSHVDVSQLATGSVRQLYLSLSPR